MAKRPAIAPPELDHDAKMLKLYQVEVSKRGRGERRVAANLIHHLWEHGWKPVAVEEDSVFYEAGGHVKAVMELVFNLDDSWVRFEKEGRQHRVLLVLGNSPEELVSDYTFAKNGKDDFKAVMEAFDAEQYA